MSNEDFVHYPEIEDDDFYKKIYLKKEFNKTKVNIEAFKPKTQEELCNPKQFELSSYQEFVRNYISASTHYSGLVAFWGVGVGKTCAAIQIAEGLRPQVEKLGKKIYIIAKEQIQPNFQRELYNFNKEKIETIPGANQCTGSTYYISKQDMPDEKKRRKKIESNIDSVYEFYGMRKFANYVDAKVGEGKIEETFSNCVFIIDEAQGLTGESKSIDRSKKTKKKKGSDSDSDGDDVDLNVDSDPDSDKNEIETETETDTEPDSDDTESTTKGKSKKGKSKKSALDKKKRKNAKVNVSSRGILLVLHDIIAKCNGKLKFVLLTATPMKDNENELIDIFNILLHNDDSQLYPIKKDQLFGDQFDGGVNDQYLRQISKGYVSYVRGENPKIFPEIVDVNPAILPPESSVYYPNPTYDEIGNILVDSRIHHTKLIRCPMSPFHYGNYRRVIDDTASKRSKSSTQSEEGGKNTIDQKGRMAGDLIFPDGSDGNKGFADNFKIIKTGSGKTLGQTQTGKRLVKKSHVMWQYQKDDNPHSFLHIDNIAKYSSKLYILMKIMFRLQSEADINTGLSFVFSNFNYVGALMIALALEENGYERRQPSMATHSINLLDKTVPRSEKRCVCGRIRGDASVHTAVGGDATGHETHQFIQAQYCLFTGDKDKYREDNITAINSKNNQYGHVVKAIIGTSAVAEGIDFQRIREVFIYDPWHNETRLHQVIGRAVRHCSHRDLPKDAQNVTVYKLVASVPDVLDYSANIGNINRRNMYDAANHISYAAMFMETSDEKVYRRIERKDLVVKKIERVLKIVAVDCQLNKDLNLYGLLEKDGFKNKEGSRQCEYTACNYTCAGGLDDINIDDEVINTDTYGLYFSQPHINKAELILYELFKYNFVVDLQNLIHLVQQVDSQLEDKYIYEAIDRVVGHDPKIAPKKLVDRYGRSGHIIYANPSDAPMFGATLEDDGRSYYVFQPDDISDYRAPLYYRVVPLTIKKKQVYIADQSDAFVVVKTGTKIAIKKKPVAQLTMSEDSYAAKLVDLALDRSTQANVDYYIDRLPFEERVLFFETYVSKNYDGLCRLPSASLSSTDVSCPNDKVILSYSRYEDRVYLALSSGSGNGRGIYVHTMNGESKYRLFDKKTRQWKAGDQYNDDDVIRAKDAKSYVADRPQPASSRHYGFFSDQPTQTTPYTFKIVNKDKEQTVFKLTDSAKGITSVSKKSLHRGKVCTASVVNDIKDLAKAIGMTDAECAGGARLSLCAKVELFLRQKQYDDPDIRWFYSEINWPSEKTEED